MLRIAFIVALGILMGFDASVISGVLGPVGERFGLSEFEQGWLVACLALTSSFAMLGPEYSATPLAAAEPFRSRPRSICFLPSPRRWRRKLQRAGAGAHAGRAWRWCSAHCGPALYRGTCPGEGSGAPGFYQSAEYRCGNLRGLLLELCDRSGV